MSSFTSQEAHIRFLRLGKRHEIFIMNTTGLIAAYASSSDQLEKGHKVMASLLPHPQPFKP